MCETSTAFESVWVREMTKKALRALLAIAAWEAVRPAQPELVDPKTGELVQFLFCYRAKRLSKTYLNKALIPALCQRAGIPRSDARGSISSHRARSTIASQLFNAREPLC